MGARGTWARVLAAEGERLLLVLRVVPGEEHAYYHLVVLSLERAFLMRDTGAGTAASACRLGLDG